MISFTADKEKIIRLWREAFGDSRDEILYFLNNANNAKCLAYFENNEIVSLLFLVKCFCDGERAHYVYAACTLEEYKNRGLMTRLLSYAKQYYSPLCLIPASDSLAKFYERRGFTEKTEIKNILFEEKEEIKEYLLEGYSLSSPAAYIYR